MIKVIQGWKKLKVATSAMVDVTYKNKVTLININNSEIYFYVRCY